MHASKMAPPSVCVCVRVCMCVRVCVYDGVSIIQQRERDYLLLSMTTLPCCLATAVTMEAGAGVVEGGRSLCFLFISDFHDRERARARDYSYVKYSSSGRERGGRMRWSARQRKGEREREREGERERNREG